MGQFDFYLSTYVYVPTYSGILLSLMLVMAGFQKTGLFDAIGIKLLEHTKNTAQLVFVLVFLCFFSSMLITNDVALLTFVPFAVVTLQKCKQERLMVMDIPLVGFMAL